MIQYCYNIIAGGTLVLGGSLNMEDIRIARVELRDLSTDGYSAMTTSMVQQQQKWVDIDDSHAQAQFNRCLIIITLSIIHITFVHYVPPLPV